MFPTLFGANKALYCEFTPLLELRSSRTARPAPSSPLTLLDFGELDVNSHLVQSAVEQNYSAVSSNTKL